MDVVDVVMLAVPVLFMLMGVAVLVFAVDEVRWRSRFGERAVRAPATVVGVRTRRQSGSIHPDFIHFPVVRYALADGSQQERQVRYGVGRPPPRGTELPVLYDPDRPRRVVLEAASRGPSRVMMFALGGLFVVVGYVALAVVRAVL